VRRAPASMSVAHSSPRSGAFAGALVCLVAAPIAASRDARADVAVEWQGSAAATIGVTTNVANTPVPADDAPDGTVVPEWDGYASLSPAIAFSFETPRTRQALSYALDYRLYFLHSEANALSNSLGYSFSGDVSEATVLTLGVALGETQASAFNLVGSAAASTPALTTSSDAYLLTGVLSQSLSSQVGVKDTFSEGLTFTLNDNLPIASDGTVTTEPSLTYLGSGTLSLSHELKWGSIGGSIGSDVGAFPKTGSGTQVIEAHTDVTHHASLDWRHVYSPDWSHLISAGALVAYETTDLSPVVHPAGSASVDYATEKGSAGLTYSHAAQPNIVLRQMTLADTVTLHGALPIGSTGLDVSGSTSFLSSRPLDADGLGSVTYNASVDAALGYVKDKLPLRFELRYQLNYQFGGDDSIPDIRRQNLQFTITAYFPHAPEVGPAPALVPLPSPSSNPGTLGKAAPTRGQVEDQDRDDAAERKKKDGDKGGGATP
jgi:hypothetical protein